jgi:hypothetical protein
MHWYCNPQLYDRRAEEVTLDEVERVAIWFFRGRLRPPNDSKARLMNVELIEIATALKYSKLERLKSISKNIADDGVNEILKASIS